MKNNMKNIMAMVLALLVMALAAVPAMAETSSVYTLEELRSMSGEQLMALAIKNGSVQAKKVIGDGDQEIGLFEVAKGAKAVGTARRLFVDLINEQEVIVSRDSTKNWCSCFDEQGYCNAWCSTKSSNGLVKSDEVVKVRFFREGGTGKVFVIARGNAVADNNTSTGSTGNTGSTGSTGNTTATHQHASFTAQPTGDNDSQHASFTAGSTGSQSTNSGSSQHANFTAGSTGNQTAGSAGSQSAGSAGSQSAGFTAGSTGENQSSSELTQEQLRNKTGFHK